MDNEVRGMVVSYVPNKRYGFIAGDDGESYFLHESKLRNSSYKDMLIRGASVTFEPKPTKKGLSAVNVQVKPGFKAYELIPFFITKSSKPREGIIARSASTQTHYFKKPNDARQHLKDLTGAVGGNCILNLEHKTRTFSKGNYKYSMHSFSGTIALTYKEIVVSGEHQKKQLDEEYQLSCHSFDSRYDGILEEQRELLEDQINPKISGWIKLALLILVAFILQRLLSN